jgi:hypothetical protein
MILSLYLKTNTSFHFFSLLSSFILLAEIQQHPSPFVQLACSSEPPPCP